MRKRIQEERCLTVGMMADEFGVNREMIRQILVEDLGKEKGRFPVSAACVA